MLLFNFKVITSMTRLCEQHYQEFWCTLKCGQLETRVQLFPAPQTVSHEGIATTYTLANQLHVIGFIQQSELGKLTHFFIFIQNIVKHNTNFFLKSSFWNLLKSI